MKQGNKNGPEPAEIRNLIGLAVKAMEHAYVPYMDFRVGAALLCESGKIYCGCNIQNAAFSPNICAERVAFFKAWSEGEHAFSAICVVGGKGGNLTDYAVPCGVCLQVMMEFCDPGSFPVILATDEDHYKVYMLQELLPLGFGPADL